MLVVLCHGEWPCVIYRYAHTHTHVLQEEYAAPAAELTDVVKAVLEGEVRAVSGAGANCLNLVMNVIFYMSWNVIFYMS